MTGQIVGGLKGRQLGGISASWKCLCRTAVISVSLNISYILVLVTLG